MNAVRKFMTAMIVLVLAIALMGALTGCGKPTKASLNSNATLSALKAQCEPTRLAAAEEAFGEDQMMTSVQAGLEQAAKNNPQISVKVFNEAFENMDMRALHTIAVTSAAQTFTVDELHALRDFNNSPMGKKVQEKMPEFTGKFIGPMTRESQRAIEVALKQ
jgi:hypothetical protein